MSQNANKSNAKESGFFISYDMMLKYIRTKGKHIITYSKMQKYSKNC